MNTKTLLFGHIMAVVTILIWGNTFVSTKVLLETYGLTSFQILFYRFLLAYIVLLVIHPHFRKPSQLKEEMLFLLAGFMGVTLYQLTENIALEYANASNVGVIVSLSPIFTAIGIHLFDKGEKSEKMTRMFVVGFCVAIFGTILVMFHEEFVLEINILGDFLALLAAILWGGYSVVLKKIIDKGHHVFYYTRKTFFYALLTMAPLMFFMPLQPEAAWLANGGILFNLAFLGIGGSALGFVTWSKAVDNLGAIKSAPYIYLIPIVTIVTAVIVLREAVTPLLVGGCALVLAGVYISDRKKCSYAATNHD